MRTGFAVLAALAVMLPTMHSDARAQDANAMIYVAGYVEVMPTAARRAGALLRQYRDATRKEDGNLRSEVVQRLGQKNHFVVIEAWKDKAAFDAHGKAAHVTEFRDLLKAIQNTPYDERVHVALSAGPVDSGLGRHGVVVVTHVDVIPPRKDDGVAAVTQLGDDSRKESGNLRFEVVQQTNRANHFTVVEAWKSRKAFEAHTMAAHTRAFRDKLTPMSGALYDERLYRPL
jgi:quinol monooxygenase YgiN